MYTAEQHTYYADRFYIMDPDGVVICTIIGDSADADALLSHLNRG